MSVNFTGCQNHCILNMFIFYTVFLLGGKKIHIKIVEVSLLNCGKIVGFYIKDIKKNFMSPAHTCTVNRFSCRCFASHTRFSCWCVHMGVCSLCGVDVVGNQHLCNCNK